MKHLISEKARELVTSSGIEKINYAYMDRWVTYSLAEKALKEMQNLIDFPRTQRPKNILLLGATNNGKTAILNRLEKNNPLYSTPEDDHYTYPCLKVQASYKPTPKSLYISILDEILFPHKPQQNVVLKENQAVHALKKVKTKVLVIDEIHHTLSGTPRQQREFMNCLKYLSNELQMSIIAAGVSDAFHVINSDAQIANRFVPVTLTRWTYNEEYLRLLLTLEGILPLPEPSMFYEEDKARYILEISEGLIGEIITIFRECLVYAVENSLSKISMTNLKKISYTPPIMRRKLIERL